MHLNFSIKKSISTKQTSLQNVCQKSINSSVPQNVNYILCRLHPIIINEIHWKEKWNTQKHSVTASKFVTESFSVSRIRGPANTNYAGSSS